MSEGPSLSKLAFLIADPSRATILTVLLSGQALTATELANAAEIGRPAASAHLTLLQSGGFLASARQGRHHYFKLADARVAQLLEQLLVMADGVGAKPVLTGPRDAALRSSRVCYDHLAGDAAVQLFERLVSNQALRYEGPKLILGARALEVFAPLGIDLEKLGQTRRPLCRSCLDWSVRRDHLAGVLGAALLDRAFAQHWARREPDSRAVTFSATGAAAWAAIAA